MPARRQRRSPLRRSVAGCRGPAHLVRRDGRHRQGGRRHRLLLRAGESLGVVGESGCGKSVTSLSIMGLRTCRRRGIPRAPSCSTGGTCSSSRKRRSAIRGKDDRHDLPGTLTSLNPVFTIGDQIPRRSWCTSRCPSRRRTTSRSSAPAGGHRPPGAAGQAVSARDVGRHAPTRHDRDGAVLRAAAAIADEPTTALDVTVQAQILELIRGIEETTGAALLLITHDLGVVAEMVKDVVVMYAGRVVEHDRGPGPAPATPPVHGGAAGLDPFPWQEGRAAERHQGLRPESIQHAHRATSRPPKRSSHARPIPG